MDDLKQQFYPSREQFLLDMDCSNPEYIGGGTYGKVFKMKCKYTEGTLEAEKMYAVKYIEATNEQIFYKIQNEFIINKMIDKHPNIIAVEKVYAWQEYLPKKYVLVLVMELACRSLQKEIEVRKLQQNSFSDEELLLMFQQSFTAFNDLITTRQIFHRDIKPENMLLCQGDLNIKITDFGVSKTLFQQKIRASLTNTLVGTPVYLSPKLWDAFILGKNQAQKVNKVRHDLEKSDIFSLGITFLQCALLLTNEIGGLNQKGGQDKIKRLTQRIGNNKIRSIIQRMLEFEEQDRANYKELLETFFQLKISIRLSENKIFDSQSTFELQQKSPSLKNIQSFKNEATQSTQHQSNTTSSKLSTYIKNQSQNSGDFQQNQTSVDKNSNKSPQSADKLSDLETTITDIDFMKQITQQKEVVKGQRKRIFDQSPFLKQNSPQSLMKMSDPLTSLSLQDGKRDSKKMSLCGMSYQNT